MKSVLATAIAAVCLVGSVRAGELEPPGPPAPTMKSLNEIPPTWSQLLDSTDGEQDGCNSSRFRCVMNDQAVLDMETGLVWERAPSQTIVVWSDALDLCFSRQTGGRKGWRLPKTSELLSLVDPAQGDPALPPDHPFQTVAGVTYWSSTTDHVNTHSALAVGMAGGTFEFHTKALEARFWCVRGASQTDVTSQPNL